MLARVCALQGQYGKTVAELETLVEGFCWVLGSHPVQAIIDGIGEYVRTQRDIPKPSDIEALINPVKPDWKPDWPVYVALKKKVRDGYYPLSDERQFLRDCEGYAINNAAASNALHTAQRQISGGYANVTTLLPGDQVELPDGRLITSQQYADHEY